MLVSSRSVLPHFFFQAEDGIRYLVRSRGLGDVYKRQEQFYADAGYVAVRSSETESVDLAAAATAVAEAQDLSLIHI